MFEFNTHTAVYLFYMYINPDFGLKRLSNAESHVKKTIFSMLLVR